MKTREEALVIVNQYVKSQQLVKHMLSVEAAMRYYARKLNQPEDLWGITGILHDFDWERFIQLTKIIPLPGLPCCVKWVWKKRSFKLF